MTEARVYKLPRLKVQRRFMESPASEVLYSGAFGAGKSRAICMKIAKRASVQGSREGLCRKSAVSLKKSTLKTLLEPDGALPPVLLPGSYIHRKVDQEIIIHGGGEIVYFGLDDPRKIGSMNLSGCGVDEAVELTEDDWTMLRGRVRLNLSGLRRQLYGACNPGPPSHFLAKRFGLALEHTTPAERCEAITTTTRDNKYLPDDYVENLETLTGVAYKRYVLGQWVGSEGLVFDRWDRSEFVTERSGPWDRVFLGVDQGYTNPAVILAVCIDYDGRMHVAGEWYETGQVETAVVDAIRQQAKRYKAETVVVDPSAAGLRGALHMSGVQCIEANNAVFDGIQAVQKRLLIAGDGEPRLTVDPSCVNTIREFESYEWKPMGRTGSLKDEPIKQNDHAMDALRYAIMHVDGAPTFEPRMIGERDAFVDRCAAWDSGDDW